MITLSPKRQLDHSYKNGNCTVKLYSDGTKIRTCSGVPEPEFPDSIDLKITNKCMRNCPFCHEDSRPDGQHADRREIWKLLGELPRGAEVAIGGGNPLLHPDHASIWFGPSAITIHIDDAPPEMPEHTAIGVSGVDALRFMNSQLLPGYMGAPNVVFHHIAGVTPLRDIMASVKFGKTLILGYKTVGRGTNLKPFFSLIDLANRIPGVLGNARHPVAFDNLAIKQLQIRRFFSDKEWARLYMGDDGEYTMFIDAVTDTFGISSSHPRIPRDGRTLKEMFAHVRKQWKEAK